MILLMMPMMCASARAGNIIDPSGCFSSWEWTANFSNKNWQAVEEGYYPTKQLGLTLVDRINAAGLNVTNTLFFTNVIPVCVGIQSNIVVVYSADEYGYTNYTTTNTMQIMVDYAKTNAFAGFEYYYPTNVAAANWVVKKADASVQVSKNIYDAIDAALEIVCTKYVPARIGTNLTVWMDDDEMDHSEIPYYINLGDVLYDTEYSNHVSNVVWADKEGGKMQSCTWAWNIATNVSGNVTNDLNLSWPPNSSPSNTWRAICAQARACCIAQLKYAVDEAMPWQTSNNVYSVAYAGWGWAETVNYLKSYGINGNPSTFGKAQGECSANYDWVFGTNATWSADSTPSWSASFCGTNEDWAPGGWPAKVTYDIDMTVNLDGALSDRWFLKGSYILPDPNYAGPTEETRGWWIAPSGTVQYVYAGEHTQKGLPPYSDSGAFVSYDAPASSGSFGGQAGSTNYVEKTNEVSNVKCEGVSEVTIVYTNFFKTNTLDTTSVALVAYAYKQYSRRAEPVMFAWTNSGSPTEAIEKDMEEQYTNIIGVASSLNTNAVDVTNQTEVVVAPIGSCTYYYPENTDTPTDTSGDITYTPTEYLNWAQSYFMLADARTTYGFYNTNIPPAGASLFVKAGNVPNTNYVWTYPGVGLNIASNELKLAGAATLVSNYYFYALSGPLTEYPQPAFSGEDGPRLYWELDNAWFVITFDFNQY